MVRMVAALVCAASVAGCGGASYVLDEYAGVTPVMFAQPDDTYRVYDKPAQNKMMVTPSIGAAALQGAGQGLSMMSADFTSPKPVFERVTLAYLASTGRDNCRIIDGYIVLKPQWEFKYDCSPPPAPAAPSRKR